MGLSDRRKPAARLKDALTEAEDLVGTLEEDADGAEHADEVGAGPEREWGAREQVRSSWKQSKP